MKNKISFCLMTLLFLSGCGNRVPSPSSPDSSSDSSFSVPTEASESSVSSSDESSEAISFTVPYVDTVSYYFDSSVKDGDGSEAHPFSSLASVSSLNLIPGAHLYLKRGSLFQGNLVLEGVTGSQDKPIRISAYGEGDRPKIDGNDHQGDALLYLHNCSYVIVSDLELFDSATTEGDRRGVLIQSDNPKKDGKVVTYSSIELENLYIHDIHGFTDAENSGMSMESKSTGGIHVWSKDGLGRVDGLDIHDCRIDSVSNVGIATWSINKVFSNSDAVRYSPYESRFESFANLNVHIHHNEISNIGKNAIFARNLFGGVIEHNVVHDTAKLCVSGNSIVTSYVWKTLIQYNEGYRNLAKANASGKLQDGCMLDADLQSRETIWQYNYSHDNAFGLFLNCTSYDPSKGIEDVAIVRYNLSVNDKGNKGVIYYNYVAKDIQVYNNTIVTSTITQFIVQTNSANEIKGSFKNNIIYNRSSFGKFDIGSKGNLDMDYNIVYTVPNLNVGNLDSFLSSQENHSVEDPEFVGPLPKEAPLGRDNVNAFRLSSTSYALGSGLDLSDVPDYFGNPHRISIGFDCGQK